MRGWVAALRRLLEEVGGRAQVLLHAEAVGDHAPQRELGIGIAEIGGLGVSVGRLLVVLGNAEPFGINLAHQREGLFRALRRLLLGEFQRREIFALEIGGIGLALGGRRGSSGERLRQRYGQDRGASCQ